MKPLTADAIIAVASGVKLEFREGTLWLTAGDTTFELGPHGLSVLNLFRPPQTMAQAMAQLATHERDPKVWMQVSSTIYEFWQASIFRDAVEPVPTTSKPLTRSGLHTQPRMLNDRTRTHGFLRAIRDTVKPGDVVIDLGTGTGVLAIGAARAGAKHVYAIEMTGMADIAQAMFAANGFSDRITLLRGRSNDLELPGGIKANVLITETVGDGPFGEGILESVADARRRLLAPGAHIIPVGITVGVVPLTLPQQLLERYIFTAQNAESWKRDYNIDFSGTLLCGDADDLTPDLSIYRLRTGDYLRCKTLAAPVAVTHVDFATHPNTRVEATVAMKVAESGTMHGIAMYFDLDIGAGQFFSTAPQGPRSLAVAPDNSWRIPTWVRLQPLEVKAGEKFSVRFTYADRGAKLEVKRA